MFVSVCLVDASFDFQSSLLTLGRADASIALLSRTRRLFRVLIPVIHKMRYDVVREGAVPCLGAALGVHGVLRIAELVQQVEGFDAGDELALEEGLADGGVQHEIVGVQFAAAVAAAGVHIVV